MTATPTSATLVDVIDQLTAPFPSNVIELKPGATTRDKSRALALAYVDPRAIEDRLDAIVGVEHWICHFEPWGGHRDHRPVDDPGYHQGVNR